MRRKSYRTALGGLLAALALCFLFLGSVLPFSNLLGPVCAAVCVLLFHAEMGTRAAFVMYGCTALLALLLSPDTESALLFAGFLGWYPMLRQWLHSRLGGRRALLFAAKLAAFSLCIAGIYWVLLRLLTVPSLQQEFAGYSRGMLSAIIVLAAACFVVSDRAFGILRHSYLTSWRSKLMGKK